MLIAVASDVAKESLEHIFHLTKAYDELAYWFRSANQRYFQASFILFSSFPALSNELQLCSTPNTLANIPKPSISTVKTITKLISMSESDFANQIFEPRFNNE